MRILDVGDTLVDYRFKPNLPVVGKKRGRLVPAIRAALVALQGPAAAQAARAVESGQPVEVEVEAGDGRQRLQLEPSEVLVEATSPKGYEVAESGGLLVALNTTLTPELLVEGRARDLVRYIQDARRAADFAISDRIEVTLQPKGGLDLGPVLAAHGDYLAAETLASSLAVGAPEPSAHVAEAELDEGAVVVGVRRA